MLEVSGLDVEHVEQPVSANWNLEHFASSVPVDTFAHGEFFDLVGNVWQWNETPMYAFDGFKVHPLYDDFTVPTYDNRHNLIKGGSWISTGKELRHVVLITKDLAASGYNRITRENRKPPRTAPAGGQPATYVRGRECVAQGRVRSPVIPR